MKRTPPLPHIDTIRFNTPMRRPRLVHFMAIATEEFLGIKAFVTMELPWKPNFPIPLHSFPLLGSRHFSINILGLGSDGYRVYEETFESDAMGTFNLKIPLNTQSKNIHAVSIYETSHRPGLELFLGTFLPIAITSPKKIVISDFDKTLVDTRYSGPKELYRSLTSPLSDFPTLTGSVLMLKRHINEGLHPFILSSSPHFYENAIRDWLYSNQIYTAGIFLKDYRRIFSFLENVLTLKDLRTQGPYKFGHLLDIILMTGIPRHIVLMGDNFESDPLIYAALAMLLQKKIKSWNLWQQLKKHPSFSANNRQEGQLLDKIYQLEGILKNEPTTPEIDIFIRKKNDEDEIFLPDTFEHIKGLIQPYTVN